MYHYPSTFPLQTRRDWGSRRCGRCGGQAGACWHVSSLRLLLNLAGAVKDKQQENETCDAEEGDWVYWEEGEEEEPREDDKEEDGTRTLPYLVCIGGWRSGWRGGFKIVERRAPLIIPRRPDLANTELPKCFCNHARSNDRKELTTPFRKSHESHNHSSNLIFIDNNKNKTFPCISIISQT